MTSYSKKKAAKIMINGWRSHPLIAGEFKMLELSEIEKYGEDFVKAELLDSIMKLGMGALKDGKVVTPMDMMIATTEPVKPKKALVKRFEKPSEFDITNYMMSKGVTINPASAEAEKFFNYYESNGWKVGKNPMKSWEAAARNWMKNNHASGGSRGSVDQSSFVSGGRSAIEGEVIQSQAGFLTHEQ